MQPTQTVKTNKTFVLYIIGFLFVLNYTLPVYINSSFLSVFAGEKNVGLIYAISSLLTVAFFSIVPSILQAIGNYRTALSLLVLEFACLIAMIVAENPIIIVVAFVLSFVSIAVINFNLDIFLESYSTGDHVGQIRGRFLTTANAAWIIAPLLGTLIIANTEEYWKIFLAAAVLILPLAFLMETNLHDFKDAVYEKVAFWRTLIRVWHNKNLLGIFMASFLMQLFFAWMVIYTPIYLHEHIRFEWNEINILFSVMLIPFILIEMPLGKLADTRFGEKEFLSIGFIIMALSTALISFITDHHFYLWLAILFMSRVGASMVEIMSETYFFKKVDPIDVNTVSFFRTLRPLSYLIGALAASILLRFIDIKFIFLILGFLMFYGLRFSLSLEDTK